MDGLEHFYLNSESRMNPNMNYGQVARGPNSQFGTFTGILDGRGHVKVVNGIAIMKALKNPDWTHGRDQEMMNWMSAYLNWLKTSDIGKKTASRPKYDFYNPCPNIMTYALSRIVITAPSISLRLLP